MEHSEEEQRLEDEESVAQSKSQLLDVENYVVGSKTWFAEQWDCRTRV